MLSVKKPARTSVMQNIVVLRAIHFCIGHFPFVRIFCSEGGFFPECGIFVFLMLVILMLVINDQFQY
jgi:hypothetical protein